VHVRRDYRVAQLAPVPAGGFAAAAVLNVLSPADWSVSQEIELAVGELVSALVIQVAPDVRASVQLVVHANHIEVVVAADSPDWITESVRIRPRRPFETLIRCTVERPGPPPARPALWPELARPRGREEWGETYAALTRIVQSVRSGADLTPTLDAIASGVVNTTCFSIVAVNLVRPDGGVEVVAVEGSDDARDALLGAVERLEDWCELLARGTGWGSLRYIPADAPLPSNHTMTFWIPPQLADYDGTGWDSDSALFAPLYVDGAFIGALSVDLPGGAPRPMPEDMFKLEVFAEHAAVAIERKRPDVG